VNLPELFEQHVRRVMQQQPDFKVHHFRISNEIPVYCSYLDTLVDKPLRLASVIAAVLDMASP
jgi:hypothetical protein